MQTIITIILLLPPRISAQSKCPEPESGNLQNGNPLFLDPNKKLRTYPPTNRKAQLFNQLYQTPHNG